MSAAHYDALLYVSFGGPEKPSDVMPFLENVTRGRGVPRERLLSVAEHYAHFGGASPINAQNRAVIAALEAAFAEKGIALPIYFGNRNWHPYLTDTLRTMAADGVTRALAFVTSAYASYSGCRQYLENIEAARAELGGTAPVIDKMPVFYDHPGFVAVQRARLSEALASLPPHERGAATVVFTAHSLPMSMASACGYVAQLQATCEAVARGIAPGRWELVYQSRSGPPHVPWLEPDVLDFIRREHASGTRAVVASPIGFLSDHVEVLYDLDVEAKEVASELGMAFARAQTAGTHPTYIAAICEMVERCLAQPPAPCATACCPAPTAGRPPRPATHG